MSLLDNINSILKLQNLIVMESICLWWNLSGASDMISVKLVMMSIQKGYVGVNDLDFTRVGTIMQTEREIECTYAV